MAVNKSRGAAESSAEFMYAFSPTAFPIMEDRSHGELVQNFSINTSSAGFERLQILGQLAAVMDQMVQHTATQSEYARHLRVASPGR